MIKEEVSDYVYDVFYGSGKKFKDIEKELYTITITEIYWHRGTIPLLSGKIKINYWKDNFLSKKDRGSEKTYEKAVEMFEFYNKPEFGFRFEMSYIEFLYPGSDDYGLNIHVEYVTPKDFKTLRDDLYREDRRYAEAIYKKYMKIVDKTNDFLAEAEELIRSIRNMIEEESIVIEKEMDETDEGL